ncbi:MAG: methyltransferase domain-containing protein [Pseudomonadales bacterium]|nr:methyltransferase domain-containing protein [Pseudomonadales bacterium]
MGHRCCFTDTDDLELILSLGRQPLSNAYLRAEQLDAEEPVYPLDLYVSRSSMLCQIEVVATSADIFSDYAYFSSFSDSWLDHCARHVDTLIGRFGLGQHSLVYEVASNDGYLLKNFVEKGIPCRGIEPAANIAEVARGIGVPTETAFWGEATGRRMAREFGKADAILANNVYAHVPTLNDFVEGFKQALAPEGICSIEVAHLLKMLEDTLFDTIYHEHFFYHSLFVTRNIMAAHGLRVFDVELIPTHGGSIRFYVCHDDATTHPDTPNIARVLELEMAAGLNTLKPYREFASRVEGIRDNLLSFLRTAKAEGKKVVAYGAPAKGNTLLNFCGITTDLLPYTVDRSPHKQGLYLPGSHLPIRSPEELLADKPDYVLILPWNLKDEIVSQLCAIREWGGRCVVPIPSLQIL